MPNGPVMHKKHVARLEQERKQSRWILYGFLFVVASVILLVGYALLDKAYFQLKKPVAKVGETKILVGEFEARTRLYRQQLLGQYNLYTQYAQFGLDVSTQINQITSLLDSQEEIGQTVVDQLVNEELIRQEAAKRGISVSEQELASAIQPQFGYYPNGTATPTVTPTENPLLYMPSATPNANETVTATVTSLPTVTATFTPAATNTPEPTATPYTQEGYDKAYREANDSLRELGFNYDIYPKFFETQLLQEKLSEAITADVMPEEEQVWARHILVSDEALAKEIIARLKQDENFGLLAAQYSMDTSNATNGGDLGWFGKGQMVAEFESAAFALEKPGDFSAEPVKTQFGYHIIQLIERGYSEEAIKAAKDQAFLKWLEDAKVEYGVEVYDIWKERTPSEPNLITAATKAAEDQLTAIAEQKATEKAQPETTATP